MNKGVADNQEFCSQKAAPPGSSLYYSILYQRPADKPLLFIMHAFHNALTEVIRECTDPGVAHMKYAWWQEELQRLANNQPRHPITQAMSEIPFSDNSIDLLGKIVEHYDSHINLQPPNDYGELINFLQQGPGVFWQLITTMLGYSHPQTPGIISGLGTHISYFQLLQKLPWHLQQQRNYLPQDETRKITDKDILHKLQLERLQKELNILVSKMPPADYFNHRHALILAHITMVTCTETLRNGENLLGQEVSLTPLRKLWIAWRCKFIY